MYRALYGNFVWCPSEGHQHGGCKVAEWWKLCHWNEK